MSNEFGGDGSGEAEKAALAERLKLPGIALIQSGKPEENHPHFRQAEVDALAETDPDAAIALADEIRQVDALRRVKAELGSVRRGGEARGEARSEAQAREAAETARKAGELEKRRGVEVALKILSDATSLQRFLVGAEALEKQMKNVTDNDLNMYAAVHDMWMSRRGAMSRNAFSGFAVLDRLNDKVARRQMGKNQVHDVDRATLAVRPKKVEKPPVPAVAPKAPKPPSFVDNVKSLFGFGKKKE